MTADVSPRRRREVIDALRRGTVPANGLDLLAVGLDRFHVALSDELSSVASGGATVKAVRGEYGTGKTFFAYASLGSAPLSSSNRATSM